jgi:chemotaxis response regulator CheB
MPDEAKHLVLLPGLMIAATPEPAGSLHRPSIDVTFHSAAQHLGPKAMAVLMTGMGKDGAVGLAALRAKNAITIAQEPLTCTIDSMPKSAIELGAAMHIAGPDALPELLRRCAAKG